MKADEMIVLPRQTVKDAIYEMSKKPYRTKEEKAFIEGSISGLGGVLEAAKPLTPLIEDAFEAGVDYGMQQEHEAGALTKTEYLNEEFRQFPHNYNCIQDNDNGRCTRCDLPITDNIHI